MFAAASTTDALQELGKAFTKEQGTTVEFAFGASSDLARQAVAGAPGGRLPLGGPGEDGAGGEGGAHPGGLAGGAALQPAGGGGAGGLEAEGGLRGGAARGEAAGAGGSGGGARGPLRQDVAGEGGRVEGAWSRAWCLRWMCAPRSRRWRRAGWTPAVVYATDAALSKRVRVVLTVPEAEGPRIVYPVAALSKGKASEAGLAFVRFLQGEAARAGLRAVRLHLPAGEAFAVTEGELPLILFSLAVAALATALILPVGVAVAYGAGALGGSGQGPDRDAALAAAGAASHGGGAGAAGGARARAARWGRRWTRWASRWSSRRRRWCWPAP